MTDTMVAILAMTAAMLVVRGIPFIFAHRITLPPAAREALELAAPSVIAALLAMGLLFDKKTGALDLSWGNDYLIGGVLTLLIALRIRNFSLVTVLGFVAFLAVRALR